MSLRLLFLVLGMLSGPPSPPPAFAPVKACPAAAPDYLEYVRLFFASEESRSFREQSGLLDVEPDEIRVLTDEHDAEICKRMSGAAIVAQNGPYPKVWRGYQAGDFYIMLVTRETPPGIFYHGGGTGMIVLDGDMRIVTVIS